MYRSLHIPEYHHEGLAAVVIRLAVYADDLLRPCIHTVNFFISPSIPLPLPFPQRPQVEKDADHRTLHVHYPIRTTYE
jgi:hypothetical protein